MSDTATGSATEEKTSEEPVEQTTEQKPEEQTSEEQKPEEKPEEKPEAKSVEDLLAEIEEIKGHSRKWETRAKDNKAAAESLPEVEKARDEALTRAEAAEATVARLRVAIDLGLSSEDLEVLEKVQGDEDTLRALAERLVSRSSGPRPNPAQGNRSGTPAPATNAEKFAETLAGLL